MIKKYFVQWNKTQRNGVFVLLVFIIILQLIYYWVDYPVQNSFSQTEFADFQYKMDSIKRHKTENSSKIYPFNPNFITDYRAYQLGIPYQALQRFYDFRKQGKYINSGKEFQSITLISDSLLGAIAPYFKFPSWSANKSIPKKQNTENQINTKNIVPKTKTDINTASVEDLKKIYGIGEVLADRIVKYREYIHGFSLREQLSEVYGLKNEVVERVWEKFEIKTLPKIVKIDINTANKSDLIKLPYINYKDAEQIILYRSQVETIKDLDELLQINTFDEAKINKIKLYLYAQNSK